ncbi:MAG: transporter substrate-binding protein [Subtercola sp.]|nr:transporter substrate-binding protein [Subtercola sp.]
MLVVGSVLAACSGSSSDSSSGGSDTLTVSIASDVVSLDPQLQGDLTSMSVADNIFDTLTVRGSDNSLQPGLATKWAQINPLTWQFTIRDGVTFTNGEPLDANAVAFSINRLLDPATKSPIVELVNVKDAVVVDDHTVNFEMKAPDPVIPAKVSLFGGVVLPPKLFQQEGAAAFAADPVGSGPYEFVSRKQADEIVLKANPDYWGTKPAVQNLVFKVMPDPASALAALQSGEVDIVTGITKDAANQLGTNPDTTVESTPGIRTYSINLDTITSGPLANADVRNALNYAVDVPTIISTVMAGAAEQTPTLIPSSVYGFDSSVKPFSFDPAKAKQLLASAGYPNGFSTTLTASNADSALAQALAGQLSQVGVNAQVNVVDAQTAKSDIIALNKRLDGGMYLVANSGWTLDSVSFLQSIVKSDRRSSRWNNPQADQLVVAGETDTDDTARVQAFSQLQSLLKDQAPFVYLFDINNTYAMKSNVKWTMPVTGILSMSSATFG